MDMGSIIRENRRLKESYGQSLYNFNICGEVTKKDGKNLRMKTDEGLVVDILLRKDMYATPGQRMIINRRDAQGIKNITKEQEEREILKESEDEAKLRAIGVKNSQENKKTLKILERFGVEPSKENVEKLSSTQRMLENMKGYLSMDVIAELKSSGVNVDEISLTELEHKIKEIRSAETKELSARITRERLTPAISEEKAREIAKTLYQSEMGKDILDCIKALTQMGIEPSKEKVDQLYDIFAKLSNIQDIDAKTLTAVAQTGSEISIDLLYQFKNYVRTSVVQVSPPVLGYASPSRLLTAQEVDEMEEEISKLLLEFGLSEDYQNLAKDMLKEGMTISKEGLQNVQLIRGALQELQERMDRHTASILIEQGTDMLNQNIESLLRMIKEIQKESEQIQAAFQKIENREPVRLLMEMVKQLKPEQLLSERQTLIQLSDVHLGKQLRELLFTQEEKLSPLIAYPQRTVLRASSILQAVKEITSWHFPVSESQLSLSHIAKRVGLWRGVDISEEWQKEERKENVSPQEVSNLLQRKEPLAIHYDKLRNSLRAGHIYAMLKEGMDPLHTDIRVMRQYVDSYERSYSAYHIKNMKPFEMEQLAVDMFRSEEIWNLKTLAKNMDIAQSRSRLTEGIEHLYRESEQREAKKLVSQMRQIIQHLQPSNNSRGKEDYEQNLHLLYRKLQEVEKIVRYESSGEDQEVFERYLRDMREIIRESTLQARHDSMIQIPLFMNQEGSNANVFVRSGKNRKKEIDPQDMSILMDLNMKNLGKLGFYLKVENKAIGIRISAQENCCENIKENMESLSDLLALSGYQLNKVQLSTEESAAKIAFAQETATPSTAAGLDVRV